MNHERIPEQNGTKLCRGEEHDVFFVGLHNSLGGESTLAFSSKSSHFCLPKVDYVVEPIKSRNVAPKTIPGGSTLAMCTHYLPKLYVTLGRCSNSLKTFH